MTLLAGTGATPSLRDQLRRAVFDCRERGLHEAAAWAAQQLNGLPEGTNSQPSTSFPSDDESDVFLYAKTLFDCKVRGLGTASVQSGHAVGDTPTLMTGELM